MLRIRCTLLWALQATLLAAFISGLPVEAQEVTNVARIQYETDAGAVSGSSNAAVLEVVDEAGATVSGYIFDIDEGTLIDGANVELVDLITNRAVAKVRSGDLLPERAAGRRASAPSFSGQSGRFAFLNVRYGEYLLLVDPPDSHQLVSGVEAVDTNFMAPDGRPLRTDGNSYGYQLQVSDNVHLNTDIALVSTDRGLEPDIEIEKTASVSTASPGDIIHYSIRMTNRADAATAYNLTLVDDFSTSLRFLRETLRIDGAALEAAPVDLTSRSLMLALPTLPAGESATVTYSMMVGANARSGQASNSARVRSLNYQSLTSSAVVRVTSSFPSDVMTLVGRVTVGDCTLADSDRSGVAGVRVVLETGAWAITDEEGLYHFEGLQPGIHVVQIDTDSLSADLAPAACQDNTRRAGSHISQFVEGAGGSLVRADFQMRSKDRGGDSSPNSAASAADAPETTIAAKGNPPEPDQPVVDSLTPGVDWVLPVAGHNPSAPALRIAIKHAVDDVVELSINGTQTLRTTYAGTTFSRDGRVALSEWRGVVLREGENKLTALVRKPKGETSTLARSVRYSNTPVSAELVEETSTLLADGTTRPVLMVRVLDASGHPVRDGVAGQISLNSPFRLADLEQELQDGQALAQTRAAASFQVSGGEGIARIELEPTTQAGEVELSFDFPAARSEQDRIVRAWLSASRQNWILVGFAAGSTGMNKLSRSLEPMLDDEEQELFDGRTAFYAKGRVRGEWLLTAAYDSDKASDDTTLLSSIDPDRYYSLYGDASTQGFDASSADSLYIRLDRREFYALYGDFETNFSDTELARFNRTLNGIKIVDGGGATTFSAFAAQTRQQDVRDELPGTGLSGPYHLSRRDVVVNTDRIRIETRDRHRFDKVVNTVTLNRHIDYSIDYFTGSLIFREPIRTRDFDFNPIIIVAEYETYSDGDLALSAGARLEHSISATDTKIGFTGITDSVDGHDATLSAVDIEWQASDTIVVRGETAFSSATSSDEDATAHMLEVEHLSETTEVRTYFRQTDQGFGLGYAPIGQGGVRRFGADSQIKLSQDLQFASSAYRESALSGPASRNYGDARLEARWKNRTAYAGGRLVEDRDQNDQERRSAALLVGASQSLMENKLTVSASSDLNVNDEPKSAAFPTRHRIGADYAVTDDLKLITSHEYAPAQDGSRNQTIIGFEATPWKGGRLSSSLSESDFSENGARTYSQFGMSQAFTLGENWTMDVMYDAGRSIRSDADPEDVGFLDSLLDPALTEEFDALSIGSGYRSDNWIWNGRVEFRDAASGRRTGLISNAQRQISQNTALVLGARAFSRSSARDGDEELIETRLGMQHRPANGRWTILERFKLRHEALDLNAQLPGSAPTSSANGLKSTRAVNDIALNYHDGDSAPGTKASIYYGAKYVSDQISDQDISGYSDFLGVELRRDIGAKLDIGLNVGARRTLKTRQVAYLVGPAIGMSPAQNAWVSIGYNVVGFKDRDFEEARYTRQGAYISFRLKFDQSILG